MLQDVTGRTDKCPLHVSRLHRLHPPVSPTRGCPNPEPPAGKQKERLKHDPFFNTPHHPPPRSARRCSSRVECALFQGKAVRSENMEQTSQVDAMPPLVPPSSMLRHIVQFPARASTTMSCFLQGGGFAFLNPESQEIPCGKTVTKPIPCSW